MISVCRQCLQINGRCFIAYYLTPVLHARPTDDDNLDPVRVRWQGLLACIIPPVVGGDAHLVDTLGAQEGGACRL